MPTLVHPSGTAQTKCRPARRAFGEGIIPPDAATAVAGPDPDPDPAPSFRPYNRVGRLVEDQAPEPAPTVVAADAPECGGGPAYTLFPRRVRKPKPSPAPVVVEPSPEVEAVLRFLEDAGYGPARLEKVQEAFRRDPATALSSPAIDRRDRVQVRAILEGTHETSPPTPAEGIAPVYTPPKGVHSVNTLHAVKGSAPAKGVSSTDTPAPEPAGAWDWSKLDLGPVAPAVEPEPDPAPARAFNPSRERDPEAEDRAWWGGYRLGREGANPDPDREWPGPQRVAFLSGWARGAVELDAERAEAQAEEDARDEAAAQDWREQQEWDRVCRTMGGCPHDDALVPAFAR